MVFKVFSSSKNYFFLVVLLLFWNENKPFLYLHFCSLFHFLYSYTFPLFLPSSLATLPQEKGHSWVQWRWEWFSEDWHWKYLLLGIPIGTGQEIRDNLSHIPWSWVEKYCTQLLVIIVIIDTWDAYSDRDTNCRGEVIVAQMREFKGLLMSKYEIAPVFLSSHCDLLDTTKFWKS